MARQRQRHHSFRLLFNSLSSLQRHCTRPCSLSIIIHFKLCLRHSRVCIVSVCCVPVGRTHIRIEDRKHLECNTSTRGWLWRGMRQKCDLHSAIGKNLAHFSGNRMLPPSLWHGAAWHRDKSFMFLHQPHDSQPSVAATRISRERIIKVYELVVLPVGKWALGCIWFD